MIECSVHVSICLLCFMHVFARLGWEKQHLNMLVYISLPVNKINFVYRNMMRVFVGRFLGSSYYVN